MNNLVIQDILKEKYIPSLINLLKLDKNERDINFLNENGFVSCENTRLFQDISISQDFNLYFTYKVSNQTFQKTFGTKSYQETSVMAGSYLNYITQSVEEKIQNGLLVMCEVERD